MAAMVKEGVERRVRSAERAKARVVEERKEKSVAQAAARGPVGRRVSQVVLAADEAGRDGADAECGHSAGPVSS